MKALGTEHSFCGNLEDCLSKHIYAIVIVNGYATQSFGVRHRLVLEAGFRHRSVDFCYADLSLLFATATHRFRLDYRFDRGQVFRLVLYRYTLRLMKFPFVQDFS